MAKEPAKGNRADDLLVFVVDDDLSVRQAIKSLLQSVGLQVEDFGSAAELLKDRRLADRSAAACLVLDVRLPGVSGLDVQAGLSNAAIGVPIIFITGHGDIPMTVRAIRAGAVEFLTKPFRDQDLIDAVQTALGRDRERRNLEMNVLDMRARFATLSPRTRPPLRERRHPQQKAHSLKSPTFDIHLQLGGVEDQYPSSRAFAGQ